MTSVAQRSFAAGELTPALWPRTDEQRYQQGLRTLRNFVVRRTGGVRSRPGFLHIAVAGTAAVSSSWSSLALVPWVQSSALPYIMEFGSRLGTASYVRLWLHEERVTVGTPAAWVTATAYTVGDVRSRSGTNYYCTVAHTSAAGTQPGVGGSWQTVWYALESDILEIPLPYTDPNQMLDLQFVDDGTSTRLLFHSGYAPRQIVRESATKWSIATTTFSAAVALAAPASPAIANPGAGSASTFTQYKVCALLNGAEGALSTAVGWNKRPGNFVNPASPSVGDTAPLDFSWSAVGGASGYRVFRSYNSGPYYKVIDVVGVTNYRDIGEISQAGLTQEPSAGGTAIVTFGATGDYPGVAAAFQQRLVASGRTNTPDQVFASRTGSFTDFTFRSPIQDDDAMAWRQATTRLNRITHLAELMGQLIAFSEIGEGVVNGDTDRILRPGEANPTQTSFNGAAKIPRPLNVNTALLYVQARGGVVRDLFMNGGSAVGEDLSTTAEHLLRGKKITAWAYQQTPDPVVWMLTNWGTLVSVTYDRQQGILGWARHDIADGTDTITSIVCVPEEAESLEFDTAIATPRDVVYALVLRGTSYHLERMSDRDHIDLWGRLYVDGGKTTRDSFNPLTVAGSAGSYTLTGLSHLNGRGVSLVGSYLDGDLIRTVVLASPATTLRTVSGGAISITDAEQATYDDFYAGLPITCDLETLDIDTVDGRTLKEKAINITRLGMWVEESRSFYAGPQQPVASVLDGMARIALEDASQAPLTSEDGTGYVEGNLLGRFAKSGRVFVRHVEPTPLTVLSVMPQGKIGG